MQLLVLRRHSERIGAPWPACWPGENENPRISEGSVATRVPFSPNTVISTEAAHGLIVSSAAEKPASPPIPLPHPNRRLCLCSLPYGLFFLVKPPNHLTPCKQTISAWRSSFTQSVIL